MEKPSLPSAQPDAEARRRTEVRTFRFFALGSLALFLAVLGLTWQWFDTDEFVNLQQARAVNEGQVLYVEVPSNHPPLYTDILRVLIDLPGDDLLAARLFSTVLTWAAGVLVADLFRAHGRSRRARTFLVLWTANGLVLFTGTRAMNEVPLLFLLVLATWAAIRYGAAAMAGAAAALAFFTRLTALFYASAVLMSDRRRALGLIMAGALTSLIVLLLYAGSNPEYLERFAYWGIRFHEQRPPESWGRRIGKTLWGTALPVLGLLAWRTRHTAHWGRPERAAATAAVVGSMFLVVLPYVHMHYFLPLAPVFAAAMTEAYHTMPPTRRVGAGLLGLAILVPASQGIFYVQNTPHPDLEEANAVAAWVQANTPPDLPVLTDAPEYAVISGRTNYDGYYWALRHTVDAARLSAALERVSVVVVSERFDRYDIGFPPGFLDELSGHPCLFVAGARIHWTGTAGEPPAGLGATCRSPASSAS